MSEEAIIIKELRRQIEQNKKEISLKDQKIGQLDGELNRYKEVANAVYGRSVLEDFKNKKLLPYITGDHTSANIEKAFKEFLNNNQEGTRLKNMFPQRHRRNIPFYCRQCYKKFSDIIHLAGESYRRTHANTSFVDVLVELPLLSKEENTCVKLIAKFLYP